MYNGHYVNLYQRNAMCVGIHPICSQRDVYMSDFMSTIIKWTLSIIKWTYIVVKGRLSMSDFLSTIIKGTLFIVKGTLSVVKGTHTNWKKDELI